MKNRYQKTDPLFDTKKMCDIAKRAIQYNLIRLEENTRWGILCWGKQYADGEL